MPLPTRHSVSSTAAWITQPWATVAPAPTSAGPEGVVWMTALSWTLAPARMAMGAKSPRSTAPYQTEAPASTVTSPTSVAVGATKASRSTRGRRPSKL